VLEPDDLPQLAVEVEDHAVLEVVGGGHAGVPLLLGVGGPVTWTVRETSRRATPESSTQPALPLNPHSPSSSAAASSPPAAPRAPAVDVSDVRRARSGRRPRPRPTRTGARRQRRRGPPPRR